MRIQKCSSDEDEFLNIFQRLVDRLKEDELRMMVFVARQLWLRSNNVVFNGGFASPRDLIRTARTQMELTTKQRKVGSEPFPLPRV